MEWKLGVVVLVQSGRGSQLIFKKYVIDLLDNLMLLIMVTQTQVLTRCLRKRIVGDWQRIWE